MGVQVGIVNYNAGAHLERCVQSLLSTSTVEDIYIVDNASSDDSLRRVEVRDTPADKVHVLRNAQNRGFASGVNQFLELASAEYLLIVNPDCAVNTETVSKVCAALDAAPKAGMAGCLLQNPDGSEQRGGRRNIPDHARSLRRIFYGSARANRGFDLVGMPLPTETVEVEAISGAFMLVRRAALAQVGFMDEGYFMHCEDLDWCLRFRQAGWKILFVPDATAVHQQGVSSKSRPLFVLWHKHRSMWRFYRKFYFVNHFGLFNFLVWVGIWLRFGLLMPAAVFSRLRRRGD